MAIHKLAEVGSFSVGEKRKFMIEGRYFLLVQTEEGAALVDGICPHAGGDLGDGKVVGNRLQCPVHRYMFDLRTGSCAAARREGWEPLKVYELQQADGFYCVDFG